MRLISDQAHWPAGRTELQAFMARAGIWGGARPPVDQMTIQAVSRPHDRAAMRSLRSALVHRFDGPPAKRNIGKVIAMAVLGGLAAQIPFIVVTAYVYAGLTTHMMVVTQGGNRAGSLMPRLRACELFYKWERTHDPNLLNRAVADARISRVPWQSKLPFR